MIVLPLLPFYALELHATPETSAALIASFSIAQLLAAPLWGRVSDRYGRRPALLIGLSASAIAYARVRRSPTRSGCSSPRAWCRARAAARPAWPRPTSPTRRAQRTGPGRSAGSPRPPSAGVIFGPAIGSFAVAPRPRGAGAGGRGALPGQRGLRLATGCPSRRPEAHDGRHGRGGRSGTPPGSCSAIPARRSRPADLDLRHRHAGVLRA